GAAAALSGVLPDLAASTSDLTTRPLGPVPEMAAISIPASLARRLASGEAKTRPPSALAGAAAGLAAGALEPVLALDAGAGVCAPSPCGGEGWGEGAFSSDFGAAAGAPAPMALASSPSCN